MHCSASERKSQSSIIAAHKHKFRFSLIFFRSKLKKTQKNLMNTSRTSRMFITHKPTETWITNQNHNFPNPTTINMTNWYSQIQVRNRIHLNGSDRKKTKDRKSHRHLRRTSWFESHEYNVREITRTDSWSFPPIRNRTSRSVRSGEVCRFLSFMCSFEFFFSFSEKYFCISRIFGLCFQKYVARSGKKRRRWSFWSKNFRKKVKMSAPTRRRYGGPPRRRSFPTVLLLLLRSAKNEREESFSL